MIDSILAVIVLIIAGWAIAKNYDAKVVLFIAALVLLYSGLLLGHNVLGAKATTGLSWVDPFKVIKDQFVRQYSNAGLIILKLFGFAAYMSHIGAYDMVIKVLTKPLSTDHLDSDGLLGWDLPADHYPESRLACCDLDGNIIPGAESRRNVYLNGCSPDCHNCHDRSDSPRR